MKKNIKLLIFAKSIDGGTGTFVTELLDLTKLFKKQKIKIKTLILEKPSNRKIKQGKFIFFTKEGFYPEKYSLSPLYVFSFIKEISWFGRRVKEFSPDVILSVDSHCIILSEIVKKLYSIKAKTIATIHNKLSDIVIVKSEFYLHPILIKLVGYFLKRASVVVCVSQSLATDTYQFFKLAKKPLTIYNGLPLQDRIIPIKTKRPRTTILSIARLAKQKDHPTLIQAFQLLLKHLPSAKLWLVGDGPLKKNLNNLVKEYGLSGKVRFFGWVKNPKEIIKKSDIFVLSSKREGFGLVLLEAMSQGIPVISTNSPFGPEEILAKGRYGILIPVGDVKAMKEMMLKLLTEDKAYSLYAKRGFERSKFFSKTKMLKKYQNLILGSS